MAIQFYDEVNLGEGVTFEKLSTPPLNPSESLVYYNTVFKKLFQWDGTEWNDLGETLTPSQILTLLEQVDGSGSGVDADKLDGKEGSEYSLVGHTHDGMGNGNRSIDGGRADSVYLPSQKLDGGGANG